MPNPLRGADQFAGLEIVAREGGIGGIGRLQRRVERDHQNSGFARLPDRRHDRRRIARRNEDALRACGDEALDRLNLRLVVTVDLSGERRQLDAELLGLGFGALLHLHEERVGVGLGDETDDDVGSGCRCGAGDDDRKRDGGR